MSHLFLPWVNALNVIQFSTFRFKKSDGKDISDHDPLSVSISGVFALRIIHRSVEGGLINRLR